MSTFVKGDALVAQVPALMLSIAAAVIVTRVADKSDLAWHIGGQFADPRSWLPVGVVLGTLGMIPAMPQTVFLSAAAVMFWLSWTLTKRSVRIAIPDPVEDAPSPEAIAIEDISDHTLVMMELATAWAIWWAKRAVRRWSPASPACASNCRTNGGSSCRSFACATVPIGGRMIVVSFWAGRPSSRLISTSC
ncbi:MAG: FHIPEP family type III secretion protein [Pontixanthobacter sp.]